MRNTITLGLSVAAVMAVLTSASAQVTRPGPTPPLPTPPAPAIPNSGERVTLTGCIKPASVPPATEAARAMPPESRSALASHDYLLTNVEDKEHPSSKEGKTYSLVAATGVNIGEHVGHRVQVTGLLQKTEPPVAKPSSRPGEERTGDRPPVSAWPVISVTSLMMVSSSCGTTY
jgi:hypothetical protein